MRRLILAGLAASALLALSATAFACNDQLCLTDAYGTIVCSTP